MIEETKKHTLLNTSAPIWGDLGRLFYFVYPLVILALLTISMVYGAKFLMDQRPSYVSTVDSAEALDNPVADLSSMSNDMSAAYIQTAYSEAGFQGLHIDTIYLSGMLSTPMGRHLFTAELVSDESVHIDFYADYSSRNYLLQDGLIRQEGRDFDANHMSAHLDLMAKFLVDFERPLTLLNHVEESPEELQVEPMIDRGRPVIRVSKSERVNYSVEEEFGLYLSAADYKPLYSEVKRASFELSHEEGSVSKVSYGYDDFKAVSRQQVPHRVSMELENGTECEVVLTRIRFRGNETGSPLLTLR